VADIRSEAGFTTSALLEFIDHVIERDDQWAEVRILVIGQTGRPFAGGHVVGNRRNVSEGPQDPPTDERSCPGTDDGGEPSGEGQGTGQDPQSVADIRHRFEDIVGPAELVTVCQPA
jgi:hypothetical protein